MGSVSELRRILRGTSRLFCPLKQWIDWLEATIGQESRGVGTDRLWLRRLRRDHEC